MCAKQLSRRNPCVYRKRSEMGVSLLSTVLL
nr:MAG TPA: hypothetical protein [Caudoviricetes sp.]